MKKGELLFTIDARGLAADTARVQAQRNAAVTALELARAEVARADELLPMQAVSLQEIDELRAAVRSISSTTGSAPLPARSAAVPSSTTRPALSRPAGRRG